MSQYIEYHESFKAKNIQNENELTAAAVVADQLTVQLACLCASMVCGRGEIYSFTLNADGETFEFSGSLPTTELMEKIYRLSGANELELHFSCQTSWLGEAMGYNVMKELDEMVEEEWDLDGFRFECFTIDDSNRYDGGQLYKYGEWDGVQLHGSVEAKETDSIPMDGEWELIDTAVLMEEVECGPEERKELIRLLNRIQPFDAGLYVAFRSGPSGKTEASYPLDEEADLEYFSVDWGSFKGGKELEAFVELLSEISEWSNKNMHGDQNVALFSENFADVSTAGPRQISVEFGAGKEYTLRICG